MGEASAKAQQLPAVITTFQRMQSADTRLYLRLEGSKAVALLKVGKKNLFIRSETGAIKEIHPLCVLDFYVHESVQRGGQGKHIFEYMLDNEKINPEKLGYDRPSSKLIGFLSKHYGLKNYVPQNNNYVVFSKYFEDAGGRGARKQEDGMYQTSSAFGRQEQKSQFVA